MKIQVSTKSVYGIDRTYPESKEAKLLCELTGKKTLDHLALRIIKELGVEVEYILPHGVNGGKDGANG